VNVLTRRVEHCNDVVAQMCDRFVVGQRSNEQLHSVELLERGPGAACGSLVRTSDGADVEDGDVLHMSEDRRQH
jgi:hypothetical protein